MDAQVATPTQIGSGEPLERRRLRCVLGLHKRVIFTALDTLQHGCLYCPHTSRVTFLDPEYPPGGWIKR